MNTFPSFVEIEEITIEENSDVYDITVEDTHNFFANGMLVHNCLGGFLSYSVFQVLQGIKFENMNVELLDDINVLNRCVTSIGNVYDEMIDIFGSENYYLELQFNRLTAQNVVNRAILEFANRNGLQDKLIVTCDAHYYRPEYWREREIYKKLGFMNYKSFSPDDLPQSRDELKCELYPKNAEQIWEEYEKSKTGTSFYNDEVIKCAIERTHDIAYQVIGEPHISKRIKLPKLISDNETSIGKLVSLCKAGMVAKGLHDKEEYVNRLKEELLVIKQLDVADYFITMHKIMELARKRVIPGCARGCFVPETNIIMANGEIKKIDQIQVEDKIIDAYGIIRNVENVFQYIIDEEIIELEFENSKIIRCTKEHKFLTNNRGWVEAQYLNEDDDIVECIPEPQAIPIYSYESNEIR